MPVMPKSKNSAEAISKRREQLRAEHAEAVREKIQVTSLVDRLQNFALGKKGVKMTAAQIKAIEMLLDKTVPNLANIKHEVDAQNVTFVIGTEAPPPSEKPPGA